MIYQQKSNNEEDVINASYKLGASNSLKVKFDFKIPIIPENYLTPISSKIELMDSNLTNLTTISSGAVTISWSDIDTILITTYGYLYYETTFVINGDISDISLLEKYLKKCKTVYSIKGGQDGAKDFYTYDSVSITANQHHLIIRKYIILNR